MSDQFFDSTIGNINTSLNLRLLRQNVISSNIANAETPGYKAKDVEFEAAFRDALGASENGSMTVTNEQHISPQASDPVFPEVYEVDNGIQSLDGNTVDRSGEMAKMAENQILYNASVEAMKKKLGMLRYAITEGGGSN